MRIERLLPVILVLGIGSVARASDDEIEKFQGSWIPVSLVKQGDAAPKKEFEGVQFDFKGNKMTQSVTRMGNTGTRESRFTLDTTKNPKQIDLTGLTGPLKGKTVAGIYDLSDDELKICLPLRFNGERPKKFEAPEGSGLMLLVLKRNKK